MKKTDIILYAVLALAVAVIGSYILHFTGKKGNTKKTEFAASGVSVEGIAYVDIDSIIFNFDMFKDRSNELLDKQRKAETDLNTRANRFDRDARDFQDKVSKVLVTRAQAEQMEQALARQQQELINFRDQLQQDLMEEEAVMNRQVLDYVMKFLEERQSEYGYSYVLGKSFGSVVLYSESSFDITAAVLEGINKKYKTEKK
jgi:outer membrane protein